MQIKDLLLGIEVLGGDYDENFEINKVEFNSKYIGINDVYVCLNGSKVDGKEFIAEAIERGAYAVITECDVDCECKKIIVKNARIALSLLAQNYFGNPIKSMRFIAVTGTNGKTSTAYFIKEALKYCGKKTAFIGTIYYEINDKKYQSDMTTPDPFTFNALLYEMKEKGVEVVVSEVSAHAIFLNKLYGIKSDISIFTNFSQDHLDFFKTMENYKRVKKSYFNSQNTKFAVINADDECGREIIKECDVPFVSYGTKNPADVFALDIKSYGDRTKFLLSIFDSVVKVDTPIQGKFNVYNLLAASAALGSMGISGSQICEAFKNVAAPEGRFNIYKTRGVTYIIDYAHTPDGLEKLLQEARRLSKSKLCVVFGCGGERDEIKRPLMGAVADKYADRIVLTEDNSRWENTSEIIKQIKEGIIGNDKTCVIENREKAIAFAVQIAKIGDVVVLAGKGAEKYIERDGIKHAYSDAECLINALGDCCG